MLRRSDGEMGGLALAYFAESCLSYLRRTWLVIFAESCLWC